MTARKKLASVLIATLERGEGVQFLACFRRLLKRLIMSFQSDVCIAIDLLIGDPVLRRRMASAAAAHVRHEIVWGRLADRHEWSHRAFS